MTADHKKVELMAQCLCKAQTVTTSVPTSSLPLKATCCHCNSCRHLTGQMHDSTLPWPGTAAGISALALREYAVSQRLTLLFCGTCSSPMFWRERKRENEREDGEDTFEVFTGVLSNNAVPDTIQFQDHSFVGDTLDGGAAVWLQHLNGNTDASLPCYRGGRHDGELVDPDAMAAARRADMEGAAISDEIPFYCHCKGVNLILRRNIADFSAMEASQLPFFVEPSTCKLFAGFDACNPCRISAGTDVISWTFALLKQIDYAPSSHSSPRSNEGSSGSSFPTNMGELQAAVSSPSRDSRLAYLTYYSSSDGVQRYFCSRCSASIFYAVGSRPDIVDVGAGLLHAPDGARAESILTWSLGLMVWKDEVKGGWREDLVDNVTRNSENWRIKSGFPATEIE